MAHRIPSYEGTKPYIFISYAHKDSDRVIPVLTRLTQAGYRVWYDDGIAPGSEWPENIAEHLNGCYLTMAFISPNSIASDNCRREVTFALSKRKRFLAIVLEPTEMSLGMEMQLSAQQCIMKYGYAEEEQFYSKVFSCPYLAPCLESCEAPASDTAKSGEQPATQKVPEGKQDQQPRNEQKKQMKQKASGPKPGIIAAAAAGVVALVVLALVLVRSLTTVVLPDGRRVSMKDTFVSISSQTITTELAEDINRLEKLDTISFYSCEFTPEALEKLALPEELSVLSFSKCTGMEDLTFLAELTQLTDLTVEGCAVTDELLPELSLPLLRKMNLSGNPGVTDLNKLSGCTALQQLDISGTGVTSLAPVSDLALTAVCFSGTGVADVSPLAAMDKLQIIDGADTKVREIQSLEKLEALTVLNFNGCNITGISGDFRCLRLSQLSLSGNTVTDLSAFANCTALKKVELQGNPVADVALLEKNVQTLQILDLRQTAVDGASLAFLKNATAMTELYLDGVPLADLNILGNMAQLKKLSAAGCGIADTSALSGCPALTEIILPNNAITMLKGLGGLVSDKKITLDLGYNPLKSLSGLPAVEYRILSVISHELDIASMPPISGNVVLLNYSDDLLNSHVAQQSFLTYGIIDCPADRRVALEDALGSYRLKLLDSEETIAELAEKNGLNYGFLLN